MARTETLTLLFTDLVSSTELADRLGHDAYEALRGAHFEVLRSAVATHRGAEVKSTGDGLMVCFTSVGDAVGCAVTMQQAVEKQTRQVRRPTGPIQSHLSHASVGAGVAACPPLRMRIGISVGEVTRESNDIYGLSAVEAARLCAAAQGGQILAAEVVRVLSRGLGHMFTGVGELILKGLNAPVAACEVGWEPLADETAIPMPPVLLAGRQFAFAGRQPELDALAELWRQAQDGARPVALIGGEPGIGKTRLAAETATTAHAAGATVLYGRCDDELGVPFQPFVEALRYFVENSVSDSREGDAPAEPLLARGTPQQEPRPPEATRLRERLGRYPGELVRLLPELADLIPALPPPLQSDAETERYRMFDAVAAWLAAASSERPLVLILDDLHWAAKPTLLLLRHILRFQPSTPGPQPGSAGGSPARFFILATYRDTELDRTHPLSETLADLRKDSTVQRVALRGLDLAGVEAFIVGAAGHELDNRGHALVRAVHGETEGNPFFVGEVLRHLAESGAPVQRDGRWVSDQSVGQFGIPEGVKEVIGRRLSRLSAAANQVLSMAAVIGRDFDLGVLASLLSLPLGEGRGEGNDGALVDAIDEAVRARLVNETGVVDAYRFAHALVHETLYAEVSASKRVRLHRRIADAIKVRRPDDVTALAHHYQQAAVGGDIDKAVEYSTRAGDQARTRLAYDQAVVYYRRALELFAEGEAPAEPLGEQPARREARPPKNADSSPPDHDEQCCELLIRLGEAQRDAGDACFRQTLLDAARLAQRLGDTDRLARAAVANTRGWYSGGGGVDGDRVAVLNAALGAVEAGDTPLRAHLLATLVSELQFAPDRNRLRSLADEALAMARRLGDPRTLAGVLNAYINAIHAPDTLAERLAAGAERVALAEQLGDLRERYSAHFHLMSASREAGDIAGSDRQLAILAELNDELGLPVRRWSLKQDQATRALLDGRAADAERLIAEGFEIGQASGQPDALLIYSAQVSDLRRMQGRLDELEPLIEHALTDYPGVSGVRATVAALYCELDRDEDARRLLDSDAANGFAELVYGPGWIAAMIDYARVCAHLGARDAAVVLYERLAPWHSQLGIHGVVNGSVALYLGLLSRTLERYDDAEAHFAEAHAMHERIGAPYWLAVTRVERAKMLLRRDGPGDRDRARTMLDQALATAREYGFGGVERQAEKIDC
ncbi:MAG: AAA family ATPase [Deltaproteobacteria bacterium]|nr:AAA family ATPase [Deltaproteobacteria bacterium]MBI3388441.1 AAA family ATPase [Deltaproteobacteria bacterium]